MAPREKNPKNAKIIKMTKLILTLLEIEFHIHTEYQMAFSWKANFIVRLFYILNTFKIDLIFGWAVIFLLVTILQSILLFVLKRFFAIRFLVILSYNSQSLKKSFKKRFIWTFSIIRFLKMKQKIHSHFLILPPNLKTQSCR